MSDEEEEDEDEEESAEQNDHEQGSPLKSDVTQADLEEPPEDKKALPGMPECPITGQPSEFLFKLLSRLASLHFTIIKLLLYYTSAFQ